MKCSSQILSVACFCFIAMNLPCYAAETGGFVAPDQYEPDNIPTQASVIVLDGWPQQHNFHAAGDTDWGKFFGIAQNVYSIEISNPGPACDAVIEVYADDGQTLMENEDDYRAGEPEKLDWACPRDGIYYVKVKNYDASVYGSATTYELSITYPTAPGGVGIIQGVVRNKCTRTGIGNAIIRTDGGCSSITFTDGSYTMVHHSGEFNLTASAENYQMVTQPIRVEGSQIMELDIDMLPEEYPSDNCPTSCFAELLYGEESLETQRLRAFRDSILSKTPAGRELLRVYYACSPALTAIIRGNDQAKKMIRGACDLFLRAVH